MEGQDTNPTLENCCICFYPLITEICQLDCKHMYHFACLTEWQQNQKTQNIICPICQQNTVVNTIFDLPNNHDNNHNNNHNHNNTSSLKSNDLNNNHNHNNTSSLKSNDLNHNHNQCLSTVNQHSSYNQHINEHSSYNQHTNTAYNQNQMSDISPILNYTHTGHITSRARNTQPTHRRRLQHQPQPHDIEPYDNYICCTLL